MPRLSAVGIPHIQVGEDVNVVFYLAPDITKVIFKKCEESSAFYQKRFDDTQHVDARLCFEKALERESKDN